MLIELNWKIISADWMLIWIINQFHIKLHEPNVNWSTNFKKLHGKTYSNTSFGQNIDHELDLI